MAHTKFQRNRYSTRHMLLTGLEGQYADIGLRRHTYIQHGYRYGRVAAIGNPLYSRTNLHIQGNELCIIAGSTVASYVQASTWWSASSRHKPSGRREGRSITLGPINLHFGHLVLQCTDVSGISALASCPAGMPATSGPLRFTSRAPLCTQPHTC